MNLVQKTKAAELAIALSWGYARLSDAVEWADEEIGKSDEPNSLLFDVSLSKGAGEAAGFLRALSTGTDKWLNLSFFLERFYSIKTMQPQEASEIAKHLYMLTVPDDPPEAFRVFSSHWDAIDLAMEGSFGNPEECVRDLLKDIRNAVVSYGGPEFRQLSI